MLPSLLVQGDLEGLGPWFGRLRCEMLNHPTWAVGTTTYIRSPHQPGELPKLNPPNPDPRPFE